jgi:hypothetical protein
MAVRGARWIVPVVVVVGLALAGVGFSAFFSTATVRGSAGAGVVRFSIEAVAFQGEIPPLLTLSNSPLPSQVAVTVFSDVAASDSFAVNITVMNTGTLMTQLNGESFVLSPSIPACTGIVAGVTATNGTAGEIFSPHRGFYFVLGIQVPSLAACTSGSLQLTLTTSVSGTGV